MIQIPIERREEAIPEGYVKVVRCKDCYWWTKRFGIQGRCTLLGIYPACEWYCGNGRTRKDYLARLEEEEKERQRERSFMDEWQDRVDDQLSKLTVRKDGDSDAPDRC